MLEGDPRRFYYPFMFVLPDGQVLSVPQESENVLPAGSPLILIGDPSQRYREDPVRMLRAVAMAARLGFRIDSPIDQAIAEQRMPVDRRLAFHAQAGRRVRRRLLFHAAGC